MSVHNASKYRAAKILIKDLPLVIELLQKQQKELVKFKRYVLVQDLLTKLGETQMELILRYSQCEKILKSKGSQ
jgi:hypothetical protein